MKLQMIFLMLALLSASMVHALSLNAVDTLLPTAGTEYTLNPIFTTVTQTGTDGQAQICSNNATDNGQVLISYAAMTTWVKKQATMTLNGTTCVNSVRNYNFTLTSPTNGPAMSINFTQNSSGNTGWNLSGGNANTNYRYSLATNGTQTINFTAAGQANAASSGWNLTSPSATTCRFTNVINISGSAINMTSNNSLAASLQNFNDSAGVHFVADGTMLVMTLLNNTYPANVWYYDQSAGVLHVNATGIYYPQGLLINTTTNTTSCNNSLLQSNNSATYMQATNFSRTGTTSICGPASLGYFPDVVRVSSAAANYTVNKTALNLSNPNNQNVSNIMNVVGENGENWINMTSGDYPAEVDWLNPTTGAVTATTTGLSTCTNATMQNSQATATFQDSLFSQNGGVQNISDIGYIYAAKLVSAQSGNVTVNGSDNRLLYQINAGDLSEPQGFYVCPEQFGCTVFNLAYSSDTLTRFRAKIWNPDNTSSIVSSTYNALGDYTSLSNAYQINMKGGQRVEIYGKGYSNNANASAILEVR